MYVCMYVCMLPFFGVVLMAPIVVLIGQWEHAVPRMVVPDVALFKNKCGAPVALVQLGGAIYTLDTVIETC